MSTAAVLPEPDEATPLLTVRKLSKRFSRWRLFSNQGGENETVVLKDVSFTLGAGSTLAFVGASGAGKSTLGRCVAMLEAPSCGEIRFAGCDLTRLTARQLRPFRRQLQMIFQDPGGSLNPRLTVGEAIEEPLRIRTGVTRSERHHLTLEKMQEVGLGKEYLDRPVSALSGGQRTRIAIARALAAGPRILILDEAFAGLDLSLQAQVANLLIDLQTTHDLAYLFISHDLRMVSHLADEIIVLFRGRIVECGHPGTLLSQPQHEHTRELVAAAEICSEVK